MKEPYSYKKLAKGGDHKRKAKNITETQGKER
jgi:hypothetical protein